MMIDFMLITIGFTALIIASYSDLKHREVPDWLSYGLIFAALGIRGIFSITSGWEILLSGILGFGMCLGLAYLFYYSNQWGGGDTKLLMGMGAIIGITYPLGISSWNLLWYLLAVLFLGAVYGMCWVIGLAITKRELFFPKFREMLYRYKSVHTVLGFITLGLFVLFLVLAQKGFPFLWPIIPFPLASFYLFLFVTSVENGCFIRKIGVERLTEGDWLAEDVIVNAKVAVGKKTLEKKELEHLKKLHSEGRVSKVLIREGVPFVPSFLFGYLVLVFGSGLLGWIAGAIFS